jgi:hypothetical protein
MSEQNGTSRRPMAVGEEPASLDRENESSKARNHKPVKGVRKGSDRFRVINGFVDFTLFELTRAEIAVWLILWRDTRDGTARTAYDDLARRAGCNRRNVGRAVRRLEQLGLLKIIHRGGLGRGPSRYRVLPFANEGKPKCN